MFALLAARTATARSAPQRDPETAVYASRHTPPSSSTTSRTASATTVPARPSIGSSKRPKPPSTSSRSFQHGSPPLRPSQNNKTSSNSSTRPRYSTRTRIQLVFTAARWMPLLLAVGQQLQWWVAMVVEFQILIFIIFSIK